MNPKFVPLQPSSLPKAAPTTAFVPKILPRPANEATGELRLDAVPATPASAAGGHPAHGDPAVEVQKEGDKVTGVTIRCKCGEVIRLECVY